MANERLAAEVTTSRKGWRWSRSAPAQELGMVKPNEVFVQITH